MNKQRRAQSPDRFRALGSAHAQKRRDAARVPFAWRRSGGVPRRARVPGLDIALWSIKDCGVWRHVSRCAVQGATRTGSWPRRPLRASSRRIMSMSILRGVVQRLNSAVPRAAAARAPAGLRCDKLTDYRSVSFAQGDSNGVSPPSPRSQLQRACKRPARRPRARAGQRCALPRLRCR